MIDVDEYEASDLIWVHHPVTGATIRMMVGPFNAGFRNRGWVPCEAPDPEASKAEAAEPSEVLPDASAVTESPASEPAAPLSDLPDPPATTETHQENTP